MASCPSGHENGEGRHFCGECGAPLVARSAVAAQAELHPQPMPHRHWDANKSSANNAPPYFPNLIAGIAASVGVIVGSIGPWASVSAFTESAIGPDGIYTLVLGAACGIALFTLSNLGRSHGGLRWLVPIAWSVSVVGLLCLLIAITDIADVLSVPTTDICGAIIRVQVEWGLWTVAISSAALFVTATVVAIQVRKAISESPTH